MRESSKLKTVSRFVPAAVIYVALGFIISVITDSTVNFTPASIRLPREVVTGLLMLPVILHYSYNLYHPKFFHRFGQIIFFSYANFVLITSMTAFALRCTLCQPHHAQFLGRLSRSKG